MEKLNNVKELLKKYNQEHLLKYYEELTDEQKEELLSQILNIDFEQINKLYEKTKHEIEIPKAELKPIDYVDKLKLSKQEYEHYENIGINSIKNGEYGVCIMAGGQGTRLGHNAPKGTFKLGINPDKTLFEILIDEMKRANENYQVTIPCYIMTSRENVADTIKYFEQNNYLNYGKENIKFFVQGELPMLLDDGKIIMENEYSIKEAADGHGGVFESLYKNNMLADMQEKGIKWLFIGGVDNVLLKMVDPLLLGLSIENKTLIAGKSVVKACPEERVGVFCIKNNKPSVIEYTEISKELSEMRDNNGELAYGESHILCNLFSIEILNQISKEKLPYHIAHKKSNYFENGQVIIANEPNAYKFESFIFDAFEKAEKMSILRVKREEEFAPVKNAEGVDSPETARKLYNEFWNK
ncbi:MAG: UDPGP type 1 family protein [Clostridiales bacterium]|nr:UDPGP type 1 family protein [Clostridiales bacterium]